MIITPHTMPILKTIMAWIADDPTFDVDTCTIHVLEHHTFTHYRGQYLVFRAMVYDECNTLFIGGSFSHEDKTMRCQVLEAQTPDQHLEHLRSKLVGAPIVGVQ